MRKCEKLIPNTKEFIPIEFSELQFGDMFRLLEDNEWATVNINCMDRIEEIDCDTLIAILDKEKYNGNII